MMRFVFAFLIFLSVSVHSQNSYIVIEKIKGEGSSYRKARLDCFRNALEKAYGVDIRSATHIANFTAIADTILSKSQGYIRSYDGEKVEQKNGIYAVSFRRIIVSESARTILDKINELSEGLKSLNYPSLGLVSDNLDSIWVSHLRAFLLKKLNIKIVPISDSELTIRPSMQMDKEELTITGDIINKKGEIISSSAPFALRYFSSDDKECAAHILLIDLLSQIIVAPTIRIHNLTTYPDAEKLKYTISKINVVIECSLQKYDNKTAEYTVRIKGNLDQLCSGLMKTKLFDLANVKLDQIKRILYLEYGEGCRNGKGVASQPQNSKVLEYQKKLVRLMKYLKTLKAKIQNLEQEVERLIKFENEEYRIIIFTKDKQHRKVDKLSQDLKAKGFQVHLLQIPASINVCRYYISKDNRHDQLKKKVEYILQIVDDSIGIKLQAQEIGSYEIKKEIRIMLKIEE